MSPQSALELVIRSPNIGSLEFFFGSSRSLQFSRLLWRFEL